MNKNLPEMRCFGYKGFLEKELAQFNTNAGDNTSDKFTIKGNAQDLGPQTKIDFYKDEKAEAGERLFVGLLSEPLLEHTKFPTVYTTYKQLFNSIKQNQTISNKLKIFILNNVDILGSQSYFTGKRMDLLLDPDGKTRWSKLCSISYPKGMTNKSCEIITTRPIIHISFQNKDQCEIITYTSKYLKENNTERFLIGHFYQKLILDNTDCLSNDNELSVQISRKIWLNNNHKELKYFISLFQNEEIDSFKEIAENTVNLDNELKALKEEKGFQEISLDDANAFKENIVDIKNFSKAKRLPLSKKQDFLKDLTQVVRYQILGKEKFLQELNRSNQNQFLKYITGSLFFIGIGCFSIAGGACELFDSHVGYIVGSLALFSGFILMYSSTKEYQEEKNNINRVELENAKITATV